MRVSSPTLPSWMGTLKSTRNNTRLPRRSTSDILSKRMGPRSTAEGEAERSRAGSLSPQSCFLACVHQRNRDVQHPVAEAPFVVVPARDLNQRAVRHPGQGGIE